MDARLRISGMAEKTIGRNQLSVNFNIDIAVRF